MFKNYTIPAIFGLILGSFSLDSWAQNCTVNVLPIEEGFNQTHKPDCWTHVHVEGGLITNKIEYVTSNTTPAVTPYEGSHMVMFNSNSAQPNIRQRLESPIFSTEQSSEVHIEFAFFHSDLNPTIQDRLQMQYKIGNGNWIDLGDEIIRHHPTISGWDIKSFSLPANALNQTEVQWGFYFKSSFGRSLFIDDVKITSNTVAPPIEVDSIHIQYDEVHPYVWSHSIGSNEHVLLNLEAHVYPSSVSQHVDWTIIENPNAGVTIDHQGGVTIDPGTEGILKVVAKSSIENTKQDTLTLKVICTPNHSFMNADLTFENIEIKSAENIVYPFNTQQATHHIFKETNGPLILKKGQAYHWHYTLSGNNHPLSFHINLDHGDIHQLNFDTITEQNYSGLPQKNSGIFIVPDQIQEGWNVLKWRVDENWPTNYCSSLAVEGQGVDWLVYIETSNNSLSSFEIVNASSNENIIALSVSPHLSLEGKNPSNQQNVETYWEILPSSTASGYIDINGEITALSEGILMAKGTSLTNPDLFDTLPIQVVTSEVITIDSIIIELLSYPHFEVPLNAENALITAKVYPLNANQDVSFSIQNITGQASLNVLNHLIPEFIGVVKVKAKSEADPEVVAYQDVQIIQPINIQESHQKTNFTLYPNPSSDNLWIQWKEAQNIEYLEIIDETGKVWKTEKIKDHTNPFSLEISYLPPGQYIIIIHGDNIQFSERFLKL